MRLILFVILFWSSTTLAAFETSPFSISKWVDDPVKICLDFLTSARKKNIIAIGEDAALLSQMNARLVAMSNYYFPRWHVVLSSAHFILKDGGYDISLYTYDQMETLKIISLSDEEILYAEFFPHETKKRSDQDIKKARNQTQKDIRLFRETLIDNAFAPHLARVLKHSSIVSGFPAVPKLGHADFQTEHPFYEHIFSESTTLVIKREAGRENTVTIPVLMNRSIEAAQP